MKFASYVVFGSLAALMGCAAFPWDAVKEAFWAALGAAFGIVGGIVYACIGAFIGALVSNLSFSRHSFATGETTTPEAVGKIARELGEKVEANAKAIESVAGSAKKAADVAHAVADKSDFIGYAIIGVIAIVALHMFITSRKIKTIKTITTNAANAARGNS